MYKFVKYIIIIGLNRKLITIEIRIRHVIFYKIYKNIKYEDEKQDEDLKI